MTERESRLDLVAHELRAVLDFLPKLTLSGYAIAQFRQFGRGNIDIAALSPEDQAIQFEEHFIPSISGAPEVRVLVYSPAGKLDIARPAYLHMHGGGFVLGMPEINDLSNRYFVRELGCVVVSVDYRLAPETRFPGALEDCYAALLWMHNQADALGIDRARIAIGGESAGGGHAAALALYARDKGGADICFQLLDSPMLDDRTGSSTDPHPYCGDFVWTPELNRFGWEALLGVEPGNDDVPQNAAPARAQDLSGLPPALITVGALDLFMEENLEYARRMTRAGVAVELYLVPGAFHGFGAAGDGAPQVRTLTQLRLAALGRAFLQNA